MTTLADIVQLLTRAVADRTQMPKLIGEFQAKMWADEVTGPPDIIEVLRDLAYDLDYVEPDPGARMEDEAFQDLDRAELEIRRVIMAIRPC
jgi:hypothetical protein